MVKEKHNGTSPNEPAGHEDPSLPAGTPDAPGSIDVGHKASVNAMAGMIAVGIYFVSRLALTPFVLHYISLAEFGLWSMCFVILSYASLGALGVSNAYIRYTAEYHARGDRTAIGRLLSTGICSMALFCAFFFLVLYLSLPLLLKEFNVSEPLMDIASFMILGTAVAFCFDFTLGGFRAVLEGLQEIALAKGINVGASLFEVALILCFLPMGTGVKGLLYAYLIKTVLEMLICTFFVYRKIPGLRVRPSQIGREAFHALFVFGGKMQVIGALSTIIFTLDRLVITSVIGLKSTGLFEIGRKFPFTGSNISSSAFSPLMPAASYIGGKWERGDITSFRQKVKKYSGLTAAALFLAGTPGALYWLWTLPDNWITGLISPRLLACLAGLGIFIAAACLTGVLRRDLLSEDRVYGDDLRSFYLKGSRHINLINVTVFSFLMAAAKPILICWVGPEYLVVAFVMVVISLNNMIHQGTGPASLVFRGINRAGRELEYVIIQFVLAVFWITGGTLLYGINGTALGILASSSLASFYFFWRTNHAFHISWKLFFVRGVFPGWAPALSALLVYGLTLVLPGEGRLAMGGKVVFLGVLHLALTLTLLYTVVLDPDEIGAVSRIVTRFNPFKRKG